MQTEHVTLYVRHCRKVTFGKKAIYQYILQVAFFPSDSKQLMLSIYFKLVLKEWKCKFFKPMVCTLELKFLELEKVINTSFCKSPWNKVNCKRTASFIISKHCFHLCTRKYTWLQPFPARIHLKSLKQQQKCFISCVATSTVGTLSYPCCRVLKAQIRHTLIAKICFSHRSTY